MSFFGGISACSSGTVTACSSGTASSSCAFSAGSSGSTDSAAGSSGLTLSGSASSGVSSGSASSKANSSSGSSSIPSFSICSADSSTSSLSMLRPSLSRPVCAFASESVSSDSRAKANWVFISSGKASKSSFFASSSNTSLMVSLSWSFRSLKLTAAISFSISKLQTLHCSVSTGLGASQLGQIRSGISSAPPSFLRDCKSSLLATVREKFSENLSPWNAFCRNSSTSMMPDL